MPRQLKMRILGIDPGLVITGWGVIESKNGKNKVQQAGVIRTQNTQPAEMRLLTIYRGIKEILEETSPDVVVVESLYSHYKHPLTSVLMGHARGVIFMAAGESGIPVVDYPATRIKKSLTGTGRASKSQVNRMVVASLGLESIPEPTDVADALAVALCHADKVHRPEAVR